MFPILFKLAEDDKPRTAFAISKNNLRFVWTFLYIISWTLIKLFCHLDLCGDLVLTYFCFYLYQSSTIWFSICIISPPSQWQIFTKTRKSFYVCWGCVGGGVEFFLRVWRVNILKRVPFSLRQSYLRHSSEWFAMYNRLQIKIYIYKKRIIRYLTEKLVKERTFLYFLIHQAQ